MKKNIVTCPRCGTQYELTIDKVFKGVTCPHCNKKMMMDNKTKKRLKLIRYVFVLVICLIVMLPTKSVLEKSEALGILVVVGLLALMYTLSQFADRICGRILFHTFGFNYVEHVDIPVQEKKKEKK